jgi:hypothetical protein
MAPPARFSRTPPCQTQCRFRNPSGTQFDRLNGARAGVAMNTEVHRHQAAEASARMAQLRRITALVEDIPGRTIHASDNTKNGHVSMYLAPNTFFAAIGNRSVVLDLDADRYIGLGPELTKVALDLTNGKLSSLQPADNHVAAARARLIQRDIFREDEVARQCKTASPPASNLWPTDKNISLHASAWRDTFVLLSFLARTALSLRTTSFAKTINWVRAQKSRLNSMAPARPIRDCLDDFHSTRPWFPLDPICRLDAIALCLYLWNNNISTDLVFGVRLEPFAAHCWAQQGGIVLNEPIDRILQYTPIMVI